MFGIDPDSRVNTRSRLREVLVCCCWWPIVAIYEKGSFVLFFFLFIFFLNSCYYTWTKRSSGPHEVITVTGLTKEPSLVGLVLCQQRWAEVMFSPLFVCLSVCLFVNNFLGTILVEE